ncbi:hypothetical protein GOC74_02645 [Halomicrobium mukohataei]|uniref:Ig-like domain-containing protein n=1 Tax=Halomicrobium mukohataei TaxID=57705 RepID=A0A847UCZ8_9EURY|nr:hypothetical protein [Halomicrobium mukohataei]NLV08831.1 hypothetical protein [Halomicrobium mukohataei]
MNRRALLRAAGFGVATLAGCVESPDPDVTPTAEPTTSPTPPPDDPILLVLANGSGEATVTVTVARGGETISEETVSLDADERRELDPGIDTAGEYELAVSVEDGPDRTVSLPIDAFDVRQGSNVIVGLGGDVEVLIEE